MTSSSGDPTPSGTRPLRPAAPGHAAPYLEPPMTEDKPAEAVKAFRDLTLEEFEQLCDDLTEPLTRVDNLREAFEALCNQIRGLSYTVGDDARNKIIPLIAGTRALTAEGREVATQLDSTKYASMPRRDRVTERLPEAIHASSLASAVLTAALSIQPHDATPAAHIPAPLELQLPETEYAMAWHLAEAFNLLEGSSRACGAIHDWTVWDLDVSDQANAQRRLYAAEARMAVAPTVAAAPPPQPASPIRTATLR